MLDAMIKHLSYPYGTSLRHLSRLMHVRSNRLEQLLILAEYRKLYFSEDDSGNIYFYADLREQKQGGSMTINTEEQLESLKSGQSLVHFDTSQFERRFNEHPSWSNAVRSWHAEFVHGGTRFPVNPLVPMSWNGFRRWARQYADTHMRTVLNGLPFRGNVYVDAVKE